MQGLKYLHVQRKKKCSDCWKFKLTIKKKQEMLDILTNSL
jgi:thioredoxin-related protein